MHEIEPHFKWRDEYTSAQDEYSPFYGRQYDQFAFHTKVYNYFIHPQWDDFGSSSLYTKVIFANYQLGYAILEFIGEWDDCLNNDFMTLKHRVLNGMMQHGIHRFVFICENVLNYHGGDTDYYEELYDEMVEADGWLVLVNVLEHVRREQVATGLNHYFSLDEPFQALSWRKFKADHLYLIMDRHLRGKRLTT